MTNAFYNYQKRENSLTATGDRRSPAANMGFAIAWVQCFADIFV